MIKHYKNIHNYDVYTLDISKDNSKFITGGGDKNIILTDVIEGKYIRKYTGHTARVNSVCFNPDNNVIVTLFTCRSVPLMILQSASGITGMMPTILSRSSKASRTQYHK
jgi:WD40 repeat protein